MEKKKKLKKVPHTPKVRIEVNRRTKLLLAVIVALTGFFLYANTLGHGYVLDDYSVIKENWVIKQGADGLGTILKTSYRYGYWNSAGDMYRPLSLLMFAVEWELSPDNPALSHFMNVFLYLLTGLILFYTLAKVFQKYNILLPFIASLLFMAHPIHTEVVANIKSRDEILCLFFCLLTINYFWKYLARKSFLSLFLTLIFFFLAFLSKEGAITMLAVIPLMVYFFTDIPIRKNLTASAILLIPAILFLVIRSSVLGVAGNMDAVSAVDNLLVAAKDPLSRFATAIMILGKYLLQLVFPHPLVADYSYNQIPVITAGNFKFIISLIIYLALGAFSVIFLRKRNFLAFCGLVFLATISLYSNVIIMIGTSYGERLMYMPSLAFCLAVAFLLMKLLRSEIFTTEVARSPVFFKKHSRVILVSLLIFIPYSGKTIERNADWADNFSLYSHDVKYSPNSAHMRYYYGLELMKDKALKETGQTEKAKYLDLAIAEFTEAARIYPTYADAYDQIGLAHYRKGDNTKAMEFYEKALKYNPTKSITYSNMGVIYFNAGKYQEALDVYLKAVRYDPRFSDGWLNLGSTYGTLGNFPEAIRSFQKCIEYAPENALATYYLGITYQNTGDALNAQKYLDLAYKLDPKLRK